MASIRFTESTNNIVYFKFYNNHIGSLGFRIFLDSITGSFYQFVHSQSSGETIYQGKLSDGTISRKSVITGSNSESVATQYSLYKTNLLLVPVLTYATFSGATLIVEPQVNLYVLSRVDLTATKRLKFVFTTQYQFTTISAATDSSDNIYMTVAFTQVYFVKLDSTFTVAYQKLWKNEYTQFFTIGIAIWNGNVFNAFYGMFSGAVYGTILFKNFGLADICFLLPEIDPVIHAGYVPVFTTPSTTQSTTVPTDFSEDADYPTDNYQLIQEINTASLRNYRYHQTESEAEQWGDQKISAKYFQYPFNAENNKKLCSMVQIPYSLKQPSIYEFQIGTSTKITLSSKFDNCQGKKIYTQIFNPNDDTVPSIAGVTLSTAASGDQEITFNLAAYTGLPKQYYLRARYYDYGAGVQTSYIDHSIQIRYVATTNITISNSNYSNCYQNVFPLAYGQWGTEGAYSYKLKTMGFTANDTDQNMISSGQGCTGNNNNIYMYSSGQGCDAYVMRISSTGGVEWFSQFNLGSNDNDFGMAVTLSPLGAYGFVYGIILLENVPYNTNNHAIIKLTYNEGKMVWAKRILQTNLIDSSIIYLRQFQDFQVNPRNQSTFMGSGLSYLNTNPGLVPIHMMFYDNGTDLNTVFHYQLKHSANYFSQNSMVGQTLFDPFDNFVYVSAALFVRTSTYHDLTIMKLNPIDGTIIWSRIYDTNITTMSNILLPVVKMNNLTQSLYIAHPTQDVHLIKLTSAGVTQKRIIMKLTSGIFSSVDLVMNHKSGNVIVIGTQSISGSDQRIEITTLDKDLIAIDSSKTYQIHTGMATQARLTYQFGDYFFAMYNTGNFGNSFSGSTVIVDKYSLNHWEYFYKHACHKYPYFTHSSSVLAYVVGTETSIQASSIFFSNIPIRFKDAYQTQMWQLQSYNAIQLYPQGDYEGGSSNQQYSLPSWSQQCYTYTGLSRSAPELYPIEVTIGQTATYLLNARDFLQCQGYPLSAYSIQYETSSTTATTSNSFITILPATGDASKINITIDATIAGVTPSVRYLVVSTTLQHEGKSATNVQPLVIWPATSSVLPNSVASLCPENKQKYPKVWDASPNHVYYRDGDIDDSNGNMLICGKSIGTTWITAKYNNGQQQGFILTLDKNGLQYWGYSATSVNTGTMSEFSSCAFGVNQSGVYALLLSYTKQRSYTSSYASLKVIIVKFEYGRGRPIYMRQAIGTYDYSANLLYNTFVIEKANNALYIAANRTDISATRNHQFAKIDISGDYPVQQYYSYATSSEANYQPIQTMLTSENTDYFYSFGAISYASSTTYQVLTKYNKTTGEKLANLAYQHSLSGGAYISQAFVEDGTFLYLAVTQGSLSIYATKITISTFTHSIDRAYDHLYWSPVATGITQDADYIYIVYIADGQQQIMNKFFKTNMTLVAIYQQIFNYQFHQFIVLTCCKVIILREQN
eukprot:403351237